MKIRIRSALSVMSLCFLFVSVPYVSFSATQMFEQALQALPQKDRDIIMDRMAERHIRLMEEQNGLDALSMAEKDQLASAMALQEMPLLGKYLGQRDVPVNLMEKMRNKMMGNITTDIVSHNQALCMPIIQPHMSKEVRKRMQVTTIPMFTSGIIERVQARFQTTL